MCSKDETLIIIGNGFDLFHGLSTKFSDFAKYLKVENEKVYNKIKNYFNLEEEWEWNQIEEKVKEYIRNYEESKDGSVFKKYYMEDFKSDNTLIKFNNMLELFKDEFVKYLKTLKIDSNLYNQNVYELINECEILSFNYTKTIEEIYTNHKVTHLHGELTDICTGVDVCIGYDSVNMGFENILNDIIRTLDFYNNEWIRNRVNKATQIINFTNGKGNELCNIKLDKLNEFKKIIIFGHSLGKSDTLLTDQLKGYEGEIEIIDYWENKENEQSIRSRLSSILKEKKFTLKNSKDFINNIKVSKNIDELTKYLNKEKNIIDINEEGKEKLLAIGYLNLITPYKHFFHCGKNKNGKHQYSKKVSIDEYVILYRDDLNQTTLIRDLLYNFEKLIKSNISNYISNKYSLQDINIVKEMIIFDIDARILYIGSQSQMNQKMKYKVELLEKLKDRFLSEKAFYLVINQLELSHLRTILEVYNIPRKEIRYFKNNFKLFRILRNSLSHGDTIQIHLNRLCDIDYIKTIKIIKRVNKFNIKTTNQIKYNILNSSYKKYHDKIDIE